jgi:elongation factor Ts
MEIPVEKVKELRQKTGAGVLECRNALAEAKADIEKAALILRQKGITKAEKRTSRATEHGIIHAYIHPPGRLGVLLELNCETDFVARNEDFKQLAKDIAMHVAASAPMYIRREDVSEEDLKKEKEIYESQARSEGKPDKVVERIVSGRMEKFYQEFCLLEQPFVRNPDITIEELIKEKIAVIGENINIRRFVRYAVGEEIKQ